MAVKTRWLGCWLSVSDTTKKRGYVDETGICITRVRNSNT